MSVVRMSRLLRGVGLCLATSGLASAIGFAQTPPRDAVSDSVGASFGEFRVDEAGQATYSLPIFAPPGTAGVQPKLALAYNSSGGTGVLGKGWSISGTSAITRCRRTREHGDFMAGGVPVDGNPKPITFTRDDAFCLDGQRLLRVSGASDGDDGAVYSPEFDPFTRVVSHGGNNGTGISYGGPTWFSVRRKDGSVSEYGNTLDSRIERLACTLTSQQCEQYPAMTWAQNRFEDSTGNYLLFNYTETIGTILFTQSMEYQLESILYTGKRVLPGQTGAASAPYADIYFTYTPTVVALGWEREVGFLGGARFSLTQYLDSIEVRDQIDSAPRTLRYYKPTYEISGSGSRHRLLRSLKECRDSTEAVCYRPTTFHGSDQDGVNYSFDTQDAVPTTGTGARVGGSRIGDIDGDGRMDILWFRRDDPACPLSNRLQVGFGDRVEDGGQSRLTLLTPDVPLFCTSLNAGSGALNSGIGLLDFDGDGRDDLLIADPHPLVNGRWRLYRSLGRPGPDGQVFDFGTDLMNVTIPINSQSNQAQLGDFNGDGLIDMLYATDTNSLAVRFLTRTAAGAGYEFGPAFAITNFLPSDCTQPGTSCNLEVFRHGGGGFGAASDFNGDGRADLVLRITVSSFARAGRDLPPLTFHNTDTLARDHPDIARGFQTQDFYAFAMADKNEAGQTQALAQYGPMLLRRNDLGPQNARHFQFADFNGDGLADLFYLPDPMVADFHYVPSTGAAFQNSGGTLQPGVIRSIKNPEHLQLADINGDGRVDVLYPTESGSPCPGSAGGDRVFRYRTLTSRWGGGFDDPTPGVDPHTNAPCLPGGGAKAGDLDDAEFFFADFDGDGAVDYLKLRDRLGSAGGSSQPQLYTSRAESRYQRRDAIVRITNGNGAITEITYQPLTNKAIYRRLKESRNLRRDGRDSPIHDLLSSEYVVAQVSSSAPSFASANDTATIWYRYGGGRAQAGGRGFLGYQEIVTFDVNPVEGRYTASQQYTRQDFPFIGASLQTGKFTLPGPPTRGSAALDACAQHPETAGQDCFYDPGDPADAAHPEFGALGATLVQASASLWGCQGSGGAEVCTPAPPTDSCPSFPGTLSAATLPFLTEAVAPVSVFGPRAPAGAAAQQPLFAYTPRTVDLDFSPESGTVTRHVCALFAYADSYGNATQTTVATFNGAATSTEVARKLTYNSYLNDAPNWRLGRLSSSVVEDRRDGASASRITDFDYEVDGAGYSSASDTGLLKGEWLQRMVGATQELRTLYTLDDYGNRTGSFTCSSTTAAGTALSDADCRNPAVVAQRPVGATAPTTAVHRYSRQTYTANGRYPVASYAPFYSAGATNNVNEQATTTITARDEFGHVTGQTDANGLTASALYGALGRPYYAADTTGKASTTTFRWCGGGASEVSCPNGGSFRQQTVTAGAPTTFAYFDVLGRAIVNVTAAFNAGTPGQHWRAQCTAYDVHSRVHATSIPFFLGSEHGTGAAPVFAGQSLCTTGDFQRGGSLRVQTYDVLGRPIATSEADGSTTVTTYFDRQTVVEDARGRRERQTKNALGEVVSITQADPVTGQLTGATLTVSHEYDAQGNLRYLRRDAGTGEVVTERQYDALGRLTRLIDPDRGTTDTQYNAAGEAISQVDARGQRIEQDWDALGRVWRRRAGPDGAFGGPTDRIFASDFEVGSGGGPLIVDESRFDTATHGLGAVHQVTRAGTEGAFARVHSYDALGRPSTVLTQFDAASYSEATGYDSVGRVATMTDASGDTTTHHYSLAGYLERLSHSLAGVGSAGTFFEVFAQNAWGQPTLVRRGGVFSTVTDYDAQRGWIDTVQTGSVQRWDYDFDVNGNLTQRDHGVGARVETLSYDRLNRLTSIARSGTATVAQTTAMTYDRLGNLCSKGVSGAVQAYTYDGRAGCPGAGGSALARPHAVTAVAGTAYGYDAIGQMTTADAPGTTDDRTFVFDALEQAVAVKRGAPVAPSAEVTFAYGPDSARYRRVDRQHGAVVRTTRYVGSVEIEIADGVTQTRRYLGGNAIVTTWSNQPGIVQDRYALPDHLGSVDVIVDDAGVAVEAMSFGAWGERRDVATWAGAPAVLPTTTPRGFTGHEHIDALGFIHMNGRIYDPALARFLQADVLLDTGIPGLNRYSYVLNNPLSLTDPSGHLNSGDWYNIFVAVWVGAVTYGIGTAYTAGALTTAQATVAVAGAGAVAGGVTSQSLKGAAWGAFSSVVFFGIGQYFEGAKWARDGTKVMNSGLDLGGYASKVLAHGVAGGAVQHLQGGKFGSGFAAAGVTQALAGQIGLIDAANPVVGAAARVTAAAVLGGTVSELTGGKFANGAITAAFSRAFNDEMGHGRGTRPREYDPKNPDSHFYDIEGAVCVVDSVCTAQSVALANRMHPAPGLLSNTTPIISGQNSLAQIGWDAQFDDFGPVIHSVSSDGMTIRNTTLPGHKLHPGYVERSVFVRNGTVHIRTIGEGLGPMGRLNEALAPSLWNGLVNSHVRYRVSLGYRQ